MRARTTIADLSNHELALMLTRLDAAHGNIPVGSIEKPYKTYSSHDRKWLLRELCINAERTGSLSEATTLVDLADILGEDIVEFPGRRTNPSPMDF
jgi:hypothetical protein